jgi:hypothetical protein
VLRRNTIEQLMPILTLDSKKEKKREERKRGIHTSKRRASSF